jgi:hypothetical protein
VAVVVFFLLLGLVGTVDARGGKGAGGGISKGGGQKVQGGTWKHQVAPSHQPAKDKLASGKPAKEKSAKAKTAHSPEVDADGVGEVPNKKEQQLANFQRQRDKKISQAEHLRQIAERNGNANLAANANRMEAQAKEQYAQKVAHLEKFGVTDPDLDPNGDGLANPSVPSAGPLADPLETLQGLFPRGR